MVENENISSSGRDTESKYSIYFILHYLLGVSTIQGTVEYKFVSRPVLEIMQFCSVTLLNQ